MDRVQMQYGMNRANAGMAGGWSTGRVYLQHVEVDVTASRM